MVALLFALSWSSSRSEGGSDELGSGPLGLADLIVLGLKNDPALIAKRGEIPIAEARKRAERDWPDPQIRFRRTWGFNDVPPSYTERRVENYDQHVKRTEIDEEGRVVESNELERVQRTTDRRITPGRERTTIEERFRESSRDTRNILPNPDSPTNPGTSYDNRSISRAGTETRFHEFDPFASEDDVAVQLRLYVPHPRIRRARIERAQHEINLARAEAQAEEREVVLEIHLGKQHGGNQSHERPTHQDLASEREGPTLRVHWFPGDGLTLENPQILAEDHQRWQHNRHSEDRQQHADAGDQTKLGEPLEVQKHEREKGRGSGEGRCEVGASGDTDHPVERSF